MTSENLKNLIREKCRKLDIPLVGFAPVERWRHPPQNLPNTFKEWIPEEFWPQSIYPEAKTVIVIGLPIPLPIVETAPSIYYHELYETVNNLLDQKAYEIANYLTQKGYPSINLPRDGYGDIDVLIKKPYAFFSHKHAAYLAGLGSFGQSNVLLTPEYGPRVRFTSIFTTANIKPDPLNSEDLCTRCMQCTVNCPVKAINKKIPAKEYFPNPVDKITCAKHSKKLRREYRAPCGICIKVCPIGEDRETFQRQATSIDTDKKNYPPHHQTWKHVKKYG